LLIGLSLIIIIQHFTYGQTDMDYNIIHQTSRIFTFG